MNNNNYVTVYSSEYGKMCPSCGKQSKKCICKKKRVIPKSDGIVRIMLDRKGRKGKGMTVLTGIPLEDKELKKIAKKFKQICATGGSLKDGVVEIQGDHRSRLMDELKKIGYTCKLSGG